STRSKDMDESGAIRYAHGHPETIDIYINWEGPVYKSERPLRVTVSGNGATKFDQLWEHAEFTYTDRFAFEITNKFEVGQYTVRASVEGAPSVESMFIVQPRPPGTIFVSDTFFNGYPMGRKSILQYRPG